MITSYTTKDGITLTVQDQFQTEEITFLLLDFFTLADKQLYIAYIDITKELAEIEPVEIFCQKFKQWFYALAPYRPFEQEVNMSSQPECCLKVK